MKIEKAYKTYIADIGLFYAAAIWGSTFFIVRNSLQYINPVILVGYRFFLAALILAGILIYQRKPLFSNLKAGFILSLFLCFLYIPQTIGLGITTASNSGFITGLFVAFVPFFHLIIFRKPPSFPRLVAVFISLTGLLFLTGGLKDINKGDLLTVITAMAYAIHLLFTDKYVKNNIDPYILSFQQFLFVGIISFIFGEIFKIPFSISSKKVIWVILFLTLFPTISAFIIQLVAQKFTSPIKVSLIFALEPVFAALFAWTLGGETFILHRAFGGLLIFLAILISEIPIKKIDFFKILKRE